MQQKICPNVARSVAANVIDNCKKFQQFCSSQSDHSCKLQIYNAEATEKHLGYKAALVSQIYYCKFLSHSVIFGSYNRVAVYYHKNSVFHKKDAYSYTVKKEALRRSLNTVTVH